MRTVVLTGASGLVGRATAEALVAAHWRVVAVCRRPPPTLKVEWRRLNLAVEPIPVDLVSTVDAIVHLAAAVPHSAEYPDTPDSAAVTEAMDDAVLAAVRGRRIPVVYASSCSLYDRGDPSWKTESSPLLATSPYLRAKLRGETLFRRECAAAMVIRLSAPFGPGLRRHVVLARFAEAARAGRTLQVWGRGSREQDFVRTADIADFIVAALEAPRDGVWNLVSGQPITMLDLARLCVKTAGVGNIEIGTRPDPAEGHTARYVNAAAARDFGWRPRRTLSAWLSHYKADELE